jgi:hypothetical protein
MNPSRYFKTLFFLSFSAAFEATSWPTYSSMACEVASKSAKKYIKKSKF